VADLQTEKSFFDARGLLAVPGEDLLYNIRGVAAYDEAIADLQK